MSDTNAYAEALIRGIARRMVDPHRGFELRLLGELQQQPAPAAAQALVARLLDWLDAGLLGEQQRRSLDAELRAAGLPDTRS